MEKSQNVGTKMEKGQNVETSAFTPILKEHSFN